MARKNWTRGELILAVELFLRTPQPKLDDLDPDVQALSALLQEFPLLEGEEREPNYRSPGAVATKLQNIRFVASEGQKGLPNNSKLDQQVYDEFVNDRAELIEAAEAIRSNLALHNQQFSPDGQISARDSVDEVAAPEGRKRYALHRVYERNSKIAQQKKDNAIAQAGKLACEVCSFSFSQAYGKRGEGYIECHHTKPVSQLGPDASTSMSDLVLLCANCHRMVHRQLPWLTVEQLKMILK